MLRFQSDFSHPEAEPEVQAALPLLALPGTLCDARVFAPALDGIENVTVLPMHGAQSSADMARQILAEAPERFGLIGFSLGGIVALEIAAQAPERVAGLALIASTARPDPLENADLRRADAAMAEADGVGAYVEKFWPKWVAASNRENSALRANVLAMAESCGAKRLTEQAEIAINREDSRPRLSSISVPTLLLCGEEDPFCTPEINREAAALIPDAELVLVKDAGHFLPLEQPQAVATAIKAWLSTLNTSKGHIMAEAEITPKSSRAMQPTDSNPSGEPVLQVERRDYPQLAPENRQRVQSMKGFDDVYTDIVDYIVRCTHKIWDERDIGLIYTHYTHNAVLYGTLGALYNREDVVRDTIQRLVSLPERRGMATQVIWRGDDVEGFYTSHLVTGSGRHTQFGHYGKPTGRTFVSRTIADCMIFENKIYREWVVADTMAIFQQLGLDLHGYATNTARSMLDKGLTMLDIGENRRLLGQYPPEAEADVSIAHTPLEEETLRWMHEVFNKRMFGKIRDVYAPTCMYHGPKMRELYGPASVLHQYLGLIGSLPDAAFMPQHICSSTLR